MNKIRLVVLVIAVEVMLTVLLGLGAYFGFSIYPYSLSSLGTTAEAEQIQASLPLYMPTLMDLKVPYTTFEAGPMDLGFLSVALTLIVLAIQSFVRGMYLGGLKQEIRSSSESSRSFLENGRHYFGRMLAWSICQLTFSYLSIMLGYAFFPLGFILIILSLFFALTPYIIVIRDQSFRSALLSAPGILRRNFWSLVLLALFAMIITMIVGIPKFLPMPLGYMLPLIGHVVMGTWLISLLMSKLMVKLPATRESIAKSERSSDEYRSTWAVSLAYLLAGCLLIVCGGAASMGKHLLVFDFGSKKVLEGLSYQAAYSNIYSQYPLEIANYSWSDEGFKLSFPEATLASLAAGKQPQELRGIADIEWIVNEQKVISNYPSTHYVIEPHLRKAKLMYRLVRQQTKEGVYYTSARGAAVIIDGSESSHIPLDVEVMLSGDGSQLYVLQYEKRLEVKNLLDVSKDGKHMIIGLSRLNPDNIRMYWFSDRADKEAVFDLLAAKNDRLGLSGVTDWSMALAIALQEADGHQVSIILELLRKQDVTVTAPEWSELQWSTYLRQLYNVNDPEEFIEYISKPGKQFEFVSSPITKKVSTDDSSDDSTETDELMQYELPVIFPKQTLKINYTQSYQSRKMIGLEIKFLNE